MQKPIAPKGTIELNIGYEGVIPQDATRLTRLGVPAETARHSDWDQISPTFTGLRGIGYVAWYPIATDAANMSNASTFSEVVGRWKRREAGAEMSLRVSEVGANPAGPPLVFCNGRMTQGLSEDLGHAHLSWQTSTFQMSRSTTPFLAIGGYQQLNTQGAEIAYLSENKSGADDYVLALSQVSPSASVWLGGHTPPKGARPRIIDLPDAKAAPFESDDTLLLPLTTDETSMLLMAVRQSAQLDLSSPHAWISQGLAGYLQARYVEQEKDRDVAVAYLQSHRGALAEAEGGEPQERAERGDEHSLINSTDEFYVQTKAMNVWWMLRDLVGEQALTAALHNYNADDDKDATYMQKLWRRSRIAVLRGFSTIGSITIAACRISAWRRCFRGTVRSGGYLVTVTVENLGNAAAEVPVTVHMQEEATERSWSPASPRPRFEF